MSIPPLFTCPISLELLNDPVTLCTGQTYDRPCIEKWLSLGNLTCPISMQKLHDLSLVPNHTLKHLIDQWLKTHHHHLDHHDYDDDIGDDNFNFKSLKQRLEAEDTPYEQRIQALEQVRCLLLDDLGSKREVLTQMGLFPLVIRLVFGGQDRACLVEKGLFCVVKMMGYCSLGHLNVLLEEVPYFESFKTMLERGSSMVKIRLCEMIEAIFTSSSMDTQELATKIGNDTKVLKSLITCLDQYQQDPEASEGGIKAISAVLLRSSTEVQYRENMVKQGLVHSLVGYIQQEKNMMVSKAVRALELLLELQSGKDEFLAKEVPGGVRALVRLVFRVSGDEEVSESAVNSLMVLCCESKMVRDVTICGGLLTQLLLLLQSQCSGRTKTRARMLLKLLRAMWGKDHPKYNVL